MEVIMSKCSEDISKSPLNHISKENKNIDPLPLSTLNTICKSVWRRYDLPCSEQDTDFHENRYDFRITPQKEVLRHDTRWSSQNTDSRKKN